MINEITYKYNTEDHVYKKKKKKIEKYDVKILLGQLKKLLFGPKYQFKYDHNLMYIYVCICHAYGMHNLQIANTGIWNSIQLI